MDVTCGTQEAVLKRSKCIYRSSPAGGDINLSIHQNLTVPSENQQCLWRQPGDSFKKYIKFKCMLDVSPLPAVCTDCCGNQP